MVNKIVFPQQITINMITVMKVVIVVPVVPALCDRRHFGHMMQTQPGQHCEPSQSHDVNAEYISSCIKVPPVSTSIPLEHIPLGII